MRLPRTQLAAWALLLVAVAQADETVPYLDRSLPSEVRIKDLLSRLTLEEKIGLIHANSKLPPAASLGWAFLSPGPTMARMA